MSDMRTPLAKARDRWLDSADGKECSNPLTLKTTADQRQYLENRLVRAFLAGADWMERQKQKRKRPNAGTERQHPWQRYHRALADSANKR